MNSTYVDLLASPHRSPCYVVIHSMIVCKESCKVSLYVWICCLCSAIVSAADLSRRRRRVWSRTATSLLQLWTKSSSCSSAMCPSRREVTRLRQWSPIWPVRPSWISISSKVSSIARSTCLKDVISASIAVAMPRASVDEFLNFFNSTETLRQIPRTVTTPAVADMGSMVVKMLTRRMRARLGWDMIRKPGSHMTSYASIGFLLPRQRLHATVSRSGSEYNYSLHKKFVATRRWWLIRVQNNFHLV